MRSILGVLILALAIVAAASAGTPPRVRAELIPSEAVVGNPWRAVVSISPPVKATIEARGPTTIRSKLVRIRKSKRYAGTPVPAAGT